MSKWSKNRRGHVISLARTNPTVDSYATGNFNAVTNAFMPDEIRVKLIYNESLIDVGLAVGGTNAQYFRLSNPTDPDLTGAGHQPMGYDQLTALYSKCTVSAAKITYQLFPSQSAAFNTHVQLTGRPYTDSDTPPIVINDEFERGNAICTVVSGSNMPSTPNKMYVRNWARAGKTTPKDFENDDDYEIVNSNSTYTPINEIRFAILTRGIGLATDIRYALVVNIEYYCKFFERKIVSPS